MKTLIDHINEVFSKDGLLCSDYGFEYRYEQHIYAQDVASWLADGENSNAAFMQGETGIGKSLAYLITLCIHVAMSKGKRGLVSTYTIHLIRQLQNDIGLVREVLNKQGMRPLSFCNRLGRRQYASKTAVEDLYAATEDPGDKALILGWLKKLESGYGPYVYVRWWQEQCELKQHVEGISLGLNENSSFDDCQWYREACFQSKIADIVFTSHTVTSLCARGYGIFEAKSSKPFGYIFVDEADRLPEAAESLMRFRSSPSRLANICTELSETADWKKKDVLKLQSTLSEFQNEIDEIGHVYRDKQAILSRDLPAGIGRKLLTTAEGALSLLEPMLKKVVIQDEVHVRGYHQLQSFSKNLKNILQDKYESSCLAWSPAQRKGSIATDNPFAALSIGALLKGKEGGLPPAKVLFTSATLSLSGRHGISRFSVLRSHFGIAEDRVTAYGVYEPESFGNINFVLSPQYVPTPFTGRGGDVEEKRDYNPEWLAHVKAMIDEAVSQGTTLVLCPSYAEVEELKHQLKNSQIGFHSRGERLEDYLYLLRNCDIKALVTPAAWEGVSIRAKDGGQLLKNILVTRLPLQPPDQVTLNAFKAQYMSQEKSESSAKSIFFARIRDRGLRKFKQGLIGRGVRSSSDSVKAWIADPRVGPDRKYRLGGIIPERFEHNYQTAVMFPREDQVKEQEDNSNKKREVLAWL